MMGCHCCAVTVGGACVRPPAPRSSVEAGSEHLQPYGSLGGGGGGLGTRNRLMLVVHVERPTASQLNHLTPVSQPQLQRPEEEETDGRRD
ncbi:hypothetical protein INR49_010094 [Caranx melampygus]|nr:hypothetical protein INR49_010094 [Caranx melampygus]